MSKALCAADTARFFSASSVFAILGVALLCGPAMADPDPAGPANPATPASTAPARGGGELEEIIVTAEKRESTVQATPIAMTALSAGDLSEQNITSIQDLVGAIPGISLRTAGPGQTEYEMRGLASSGGSVATVGFYLDETPLSASAVALNGRTVIDADLYDLNRTEILRGPQGTLYGAGSMGGTIKLVTNPPKLHELEGSAEVDASQTTGGSTNGHGSLMLNFPIGDIAALRFVTTDKYISGFIHRYVIAPGQFPYPTNFGNCGVYYCNRGDVQDAPVAQDHANSNIERFISSRASLLVQPSDALSITGNFMYQRIDADGYNNYQAPPNNEAIYQPYDIKEPYYDSFHMWSLKVSYDMSFANLTSASSYWKRDVYQSTDSTEALQNIFNYTQFVPNLYEDNDTTWQIAQELRLTSRGDGNFQWVGGLYYSNLHSGYVTKNQTPRFVTTPACPQTQPYPLGGHCPASDQFTFGSFFPPGSPGYNPEGIMFNDNNPNMLNQKAIFGEANYKVTPTLKVTAGLRFYKFDISNEANQRGLGTANRECHTHDCQRLRKQYQSIAEG